jgi:hypothetical protein
MQIRLVNDKNCRFDAKSVGMFAYGIKVIVIHLSD